MKKTIPVAVLIILISVIEFILTLSVPAAALHPPDVPYKPLERSREELYQDIFISLLLPYIQHEVNAYYSTYLTESPDVASYMVYIISAERIGAYRTFVFRLKLRVDSYIGPHISVGLDYITVTVYGWGGVNIDKFEHIKSFALPPNYADIIKQGYGNPIP